MSPGFVYPLERPETPDSDLFRAGEQGMIENGYDGLYGWDFGGAQVRWT